MMLDHTALRGGMSVTLRQHLPNLGPKKIHTPEDEDWCALAEPEFTHEIRMSC